MTDKSRAWMRNAAGALVVIVLCLFALPVEVNAQSRKRVLMFFSLRQDSPIYASVQKSLVTPLREKLNGQLDDYTEYIDEPRFSDPNYQAALREFISHKYAGQRFDLIITVQRSALTFATQFAEELFPNTPVVFIAGKGLETENERPRTNFTGVLYKVDLKPTLENALQIQPDLRQVYVITGAANFDKHYEQGAREQFREFERRIAFTYSSGRSVDEVVADVKRLPPNSAIYQITMTEDRLGNRFGSGEALTQIAQQARVPIYSFKDTDMGKGILGGTLLSYDRMFELAVPVTLRVLNGEPADAIPVLEIFPSVTEFDWRQLRRFGFSEASLPAGSVVQFREPTFWERYRWRIVGAFSVMLLQAVLIGVLLIEHKRRWRASQKLRDLATRLISLQDEEHRRIAGELHDGLGQSLSIIRNRATLCKEDIADPESAAEQLDEISEAAVSAIEEVRQIAHNLRPYELDRLGLTAAVQSMIARVSEVTEIQVSADLDQIDGLLSSAAETSIYRIVQEALNNVIKHADASEVRVAIKHLGPDVVVSVHDNGRGINRNNGNGKNGDGFGLQSISERARMFGGDYSLVSQPERGTLMTVRVAINNRKNGQQNSHSDR